MRVGVAGQRPGSRMRDSVAVTRVSFSDNCIIVVVAWIRRAQSALQMRLLADPVSLGAGSKYNRISIVKTMKYHHGEGKRFF